MEAKKTEKKNQVLGRSQDPNWIAVNGYATHQQTGGLLVYLERNHSG